MSSAVAEWIELRLGLRVVNLQLVYTDAAIYVDRNRQIEIGHLSSPIPESRPIIFLRLSIFCLYLHFPLPLFQRSQSHSVAYDEEKKPTQRYVISKPGQLGRVQRLHDKIAGGYTARGDGRLPSQGRQTTISVVDVRIACWIKTSVMASQ